MDKMDNSQPKSAKEMLEDVRSFDMTAVINRYCKENNETLERAKKIADETRHFLVLCALNKSRKGYAIRNPIDQMWHTFIIFTKDYFGFCRLLGKTYLHHVPTEKSTRKSSAQSRFDSYVELLLDYEKTFGYEAPKEIWPEPELKLQSTDCSSGLNCSVCLPPCSSSEN